MTKAAHLHSNDLPKQLDKSARLLATGQLVPARAILERIVATHPNHVGAISDLATIAARLGDLPKALEYALGAVKLEPTNGRLMLIVGWLLFKMSRHDQASEAFRIATQLDPNDANAHNAYGIALHSLERWDESTVASLRAIELDPQLAGPYDSLAVTLVAQREYDRAVELFHEAIRRRPRSWEAWHNLGSSLGVVGGRTAEAVAALRQAIALDPGQPLSHMNLGTALLKLGDFENGWAEYEYRWQCGAHAAVRRPESLPWWDGSAAPRTLLLHAEQGFGDTLHFCRYAPLVAARGHRVVLEVQPELAELLADSLGSDSITVVPRSAAYPSLAGLPPVDAHCPLMSLPLILATRLETVPGAPYLRADPERSLIWRDRLAGLGEGMRVGLVWAGSPRRDAEISMRLADARRSTTLASLGPLLDVPGVRFVSLQKGEGVAELREARFAGVYNADSELRSFADTAGLVANLDLVICVDTSIGHLVGGMGKPVWMMSRYDGCFRWLEDRPDTPWYPSMRIFRQGADRGWGPVVAELATALAETAGTQRHLAAAE